ncbi:MAG: ABC transporter substrate-binding protein [Deltaproteobacteria bacterium]|nr:ABC transporter substrate-binding protein [Deltaproteobacteria bacterium]
MALKGKSILLIAVSMALVAAASYLLIGREGSPPKTESVVVAYSPFESGTLFYVACDTGLFARHGIRVDPRRYDTGAGSLEGMVNGQADITVGVTEFPMVRQALRKARIRVVGSIDKAAYIYLIGRKDRGIERVADLAGKRVGTTQGTVAEFHLGRFLEINGLSMSDIRAVNLTAPEEWVGAVRRGDVDAICTAQPYAHELQKALGANGVAWPAQGSQPLHGLIAAKEDWIVGNPDLLRRFLQSLAEAEDYAMRHPAETRAILQRWLGLDAAYLDTAWSQNQFALSLDQSLIVAMEDEARWMIRNKLTAEERVPNFLNYIHADALKAIRPAAVAIMGR